MTPDRIAFVAWLCLLLANRAHARISSPVIDSMDYFGEFGETILAKQLHVLSKLKIYLFYVF